MLFNLPNFHLLQLPNYQIVIFFLTVFNERKIEIQSENSPEIGGSCRESMFMSSDTGKIRKAAHLGMDNLNTGRFCSLDHTDSSDRSRLSNQKLILSLILPYKRSNTQYIPQVGRTWSERITTMKAYANGSILR